MSLAVNFKIKRNMVEMVKSYSFNQEQAVFIVDYVWRKLKICDSMDFHKEKFPVDEFSKQIFEMINFAKTYPWK